MSQKQPKPTLTGQRIRTRKRDEKEKYDPEQFRDSIIKPLKECNGNLDEITKTLDKLGNSLDYHRYGDVLFDVLIAGGLISQGGQVILEDAEISPFCMFHCPETLDGLKEYVDVFNKTIRRYKYLQRHLNEVTTKLIKFLKCFSEEEFTNFARACGALLPTGLLSMNALEALFSAHLSKEEYSIRFALIVFETWLKENKVSAVASAIKKAGLEDRLIELLPASKRDLTTLMEYFDTDGCRPICQYFKQRQTSSVRNEFAQQLKSMIENGATNADITQYVKGTIEKEPSINDAEAVKIVWDAGMDGVEWSNKPDLLQEQVVKQAKVLSKLCEPYCNTLKAEVALMNKIQTYCYDNMNFLKLFHRIILVLYNTDCLSEDSVLRWFETDHLTKGKSHFLKQMEPMVEWLNNAEEEDSDEE